MPYGLSDEVWGKLTHIILSHKSVSKAILFGSRALGRHKNSSDIDIAISGKGLSLKDIQTLSLNVDDLLLPYKVDLVILEAIEDPAVKEHITQFGIPIQESKE